MFVGVARIVVQIPGARSLKDRRAVVRSFKDRVRARLHISVAEIGDAERWQIATFGVAAVSGDRGKCEEMIGSAVSVARSLGDSIVADVRTETLSFGPAGDGLKNGIESLLDDE
jgi:uncharacterized protein YlxP (DUF503 family)